jgi:ferredoxin-type protein NapH
MKSSKSYLPLYVFLFVFLMLIMVQLKMTHNPLLLLERFIPGAGWFEILLLAIYGAFLTHKLLDVQQQPKWRKISWTIFALVFFLQLILGLSGIEKCLMTGKLHLPIPMMIISGPIYREQLSVMTILFLSTIVLTGPAWCSHFCYFGAFDALSAKGKMKRQSFKYKLALKSSGLVLVIAVTLFLRWFQVPALIALGIALAFGVVGILVMVFFSRKNGKMTHCVLYCPVGTLVNVLKPVNPFRLYIDNSCTMCMHCTTVCRYDALHITELKDKKPNYSCTLCGDCLASCHDNSIHYKFFKLSPEHARKLYLFLTIGIHVVFLGLARI